MGEFHLPFLIYDTLSGGFFLWYRIKLVTRRCVITCRLSDKDAHQSVITQGICVESEDIREKKEEWALFRQSLIQTSKQ